jgi:hypothetical protein
MRALIVYESMYGNTHRIADAIADGMRPGVDVRVAPVGDVDGEALADVDILVVGGPTHVHGLSRPSTRHAAAVGASEPGQDLDLEPDSEGVGLREWFDTIGSLPAVGAAFDTRIDAAPLFTGRASKGIARRLRRHGCTLLVEPESFLVSKENELRDDEAVRARGFGAELRKTATEAASAPGARTQ